MRYRTTILDTIVGTFFVITIPILNNLLWKMAKLEIIYLQTCAIFYGDVNLPNVFFPVTKWLSATRTQSPAASDAEALANRIISLWKSRGMKRVNGFVSIYLPTYLPIYLPVCLSTYLSVNLCIYLFVYWHSSLKLSILVFAHIYIYLSKQIYTMFICLHIYYAYIYIYMYIYI